MFLADSWFGEEFSSVRGVIVLWFFRVMRAWLWLFVCGEVVLEYSYKEILWVFFSVFFKGTCGYFLGDCVLGKGNNDFGGLLVVYCEAILFFRDLKCCCGLFVRAGVIGVRWLRGFWFRFILRWVKCVFGFILCWYF